MWACRIDVTGSDVKVGDKSGSDAVMESELYSAAEPTAGWMPTPANRRREMERALATDLLLHSATMPSVSASRRHTVQLGPRCLRGTCRRNAR